jgi:hypothetical protein
MPPRRESTVGSPLAAAEQRVRRPAAGVDADAGDVLVGGALPLEGTDVPVLHRRVVAAVVMGVEDAHVAAARLRTPAEWQSMPSAEPPRASCRDLLQLHGTYPVAARRPSWRGSAAVSISVAGDHCRESPTATPSGRVPASPPMGAFGAWRALVAEGERTVPSDCPFLDRNQLVLFWYTAAIARGASPKQINVVLVQIAYRLKENHPMRSPLLLAPRVLIGLSLAGLLFGAPRHAWAQG